MLEDLISVHARVVSQRAGNLSGLHIDQRSHPLNPTGRRLGKGGCWPVVLAPTTRIPADRLAPNRRISGIQSGMQTYTRVHARSITVAIIRLTALMTSCRSGWCMHGKATSRNLFWRSSRRRTLCARHTPRKPGSSLSNRTRGGRIQSGSFGVRERGRGPHGQVRTDLPTQTCRRPGEPQPQGLRITIANLGYMGSFVSRANPDFCRTVLRLSDSIVTNIGALLFTQHHMNICYFP